MVDGFCVWDWTMYKISGGWTKMSSRLIYSNLYCHQIMSSPLRIFNLMCIYVQIYICVSNITLSQYHELVLFHNSGFSNWVTTANALYNE